ncbi:MAG: hypothetical protein ACI9W2_004458 [Gammaproteobacteria bacterium]|jgi:hypothetical protein
MPLSHPFGQRLFGAIRRKLLDRVPFWNALDLQRKLLGFRGFYRGARTHVSLHWQLKSQLQETLVSAQKA